MEQFLRWFGSSSWLSVVAHLFLLFLLLLLGEFLLLLRADLLPLCLLLLQPLQLLLLLGALLPPFVDVLSQLLVKLSLLCFLARLQEVSIAFFGGIGYFLLL